MLYRTKLSVLAVLFCISAMLFQQHAAHAFETLGAIFEFDASQDVGGNNNWTETGLLGNETLVFVGGATPTATQVSDGTLNLFAHSIGADGQSNVYENVLGGVGQASRRDATFEIWFKPNDLTTADQILHETGGGGRGTIISLDNNNLEFLANGDNNVTLSTTLANNNWHQVVGVLNNISNDGSSDDFIQLYLNGALIGTSTNVNIDDWSGGNQGGLGSFGGASHPTGGQIGTGAESNVGVDFNGNIHLNRYYSRALTSAEILANYDAVANQGPAWAVDADGAWNTGSNWNGGAVPGVGGLSGGDAILGPAISSARTVTLNVNANLGGLAMNDADGYTIAAGGGTLTFSGSAELRSTVGVHEIAAPIAGSSGLVKTAGGTVTLSGANTFSGTVGLSGGTLAVSSNGNLGNAANGLEFSGGNLRIDGTSFPTLSRSVTMTTGGILNVADVANTVNITGAVTGTGNLVKAGDGGVQLSNAGGFDGNVTVNGGTLVVSTSDGLGTTNGTTQVGAEGGTVELDGSGGSLTINENFNRLLARFNGVPEAHIRNTAGNNTLAGTIEAGGGAFGAARFENTASGSTLTLNNTISYTNEDTAFNFVFQGTGNFQVGNSSTPGSGKIVGNNVNVLVDLEDASDTVTIATAAASTDTTNATGSFWGGSTTIRSGTLVIEQDGLSNNGELASASINVETGATFDVSDFSVYSLQVVDDPDAVPFNGDEIGQRLGGGGTVNTGSGTLNVFEDAVINPGDSVGTLNVTGNMSINQSQANPNGALNYELGSATTVGGSVNDLLAVSGNLNLLANGAAGGGQFKLNITPVEGDLAAGTYTIMTRGGTTSTTATSADFDIALVNSQGTVLNSRQDDSSSVSINATTVTVNFSAAQSHNWTGNTNGTWDVGTTANWSSSDNLFFDLDSVTFADGSGQTNVDIAAPVSPGGLNFTNSSDTYTFTGSGIEGSADLTLNSNATVVLANNGNSFTGDVIIGANASLQLGDGVTAGLETLGENNNVSIAGGGTLLHNDVSGEVINGVVSGSGSVVNNAGTLNLGGNNTYSGATTINGGTIVISNTDVGTPLGSLASGTTVNAGGTLRANGQTGIVAESITLNGGTLAAGGAAPSAVTFSSNVVIAGPNSSIRAEGDTGDDGLTIDANIVGVGGHTLNVNAGANATVNVTASITNNGNLTKTGVGTLALAGASSTIAAPTIDVQGGNIDVTATAAGLILNSQTLTGNGTLTGNVSTSSGSTIRVGGVAGGTPSVTTGLQLNYDASLDSSGTSVWNDEEPNGGNIGLNFAGGAASTVPVSDATFTSLVAAYDIGTSGAALSPGANNGYFDVRAQSSGTFEIVFNVTNTSAGDDQVLLDIGGNRGVAVTLDGGTLTAGVNGDAADTTAFNTSLSTGWHHAVVVIVDNDPADASDDEFTLYIDNAVVGSLSGVDIDDYSGSNGWSFGGPNSVTLDPTQLAAGAPSLAAPIDFHGQIAIARYYQAALDAGDVNTNFLALQAGSPFVGVDTLTIDGDLALDASSVIELDIFSSTLGNDLLDVSGALLADGTLDISLAGSVSLGETFDLFDFDSASGSFDTINLPTLAGGLGWDVSQLLVSGVVEVIAALDVDLDNDGDVDGADFLLIQRVDPSLLPAWQAQYGNSSLQAASAAAVPEPSSTALLLFCLVATMSGRCRK